MFEQGILALGIINNSRVKHMFLVENRLAKKIQSQQIYRKFNNFILLSLRISGIPLTEKKKKIQLHI